MTNRSPVAAAGRLAATPENSLQVAAEAPSEWVRRWLGEIPAGGRVLDLACGGGRHVRLLADHGFAVLAVDRDAGALAGLRGMATVTTRCCDLEAGAWPFAAGEFAGVVVTRYLHRPLLAPLARVLVPGGVLIYETFMDGQQRFGRPANPDFLLRRDELREFAAAAGLECLGFEQSPAAVAAGPVTQAICCRRPLA